MSQEKIELKKDDFLLIDYEVRIKDTNELIDTNIEDVAKKEKFAREDLNYESTLLILGRNKFHKGLEEELLKLGNAETNLTIELSPEKAYGTKDPSKIKVVNTKELAREGIIPRVGQRIKVKENEGLVISVSGGRAIVDFNHPLAGKTLVFKLHIVKKIEDIKEKILELLYQRIKPINKNDISINLSEESLEIKFKSEVLNNLNFQTALKAGMFEIEEIFPQFQKITFVIEREKPKEIKEIMLTT